MILINELKGKIIAKGLTQREFAKMLNISCKTFNQKLKKGIFKSNEIEKMIKILEIENPTEIFFANENK